MRQQDRQWIDGLLAGELDAWHQADRWIARAAAPYRARLGDDWPDVLQSVRIELLRLLKQKRFRGESGLKTYLWRVASNACLQHLRRSRTARLVPLEEAPEPEAPTGEGLEGRQERAAARRLALEVLGEISGDCRRLWRMILAGDSYSDMAERLGVAAGTLRVRVHRCRKQALELRDELAAGNAPAAPAPNALESRR